MAENLKLAKALREAKSFLQGASNAAASNVSAPVDAIAWALRKAGVPVGDAPIGGSDWMRQHGLTAEAPGASGLIGESVGSIAPIVASAKAAQIAKGLLQAGENLAAPRTLNSQTGAIVFHGSPHKFDKFDSSKIGTGEGAQAYGHGLYMADAPEVARTYSADRAYVGASMQGKPQAINYDDPAWIAQTTMDELGDPSKAVARLQMVARTAAKNMSPESAAGVQGAIDLISSGSVGSKGQLYKVDLPDEAIAKMLDWDKPLSQQPAAAKHFKEMHELNGGQGYINSNGTYTALGVGSTDELKGKDLVNFLAKMGGGQTDASAILRQQGIPGIRYLDAGSRSAGAGSSNYVVFPGNESLLTILERNGQLLGTK
jgi:hypothetical protein